MRIEKEMFLKVTDIEYSVESENLNVTERLNWSIELTTRIDLKLLLVKAPGHTEPGLTPECVGTTLRRS